jgi:cellulose synthase (UDP-forming)
VKEQNNEGKCSVGVFFREKVVHTISIAAGLYMLYYLIWRGIDTLNPEWLVFSVLLLIAELQGFVNFLLFMLMTWRVEPKKEKSYPKTYKTIDVFIPTYNEDLEILEATVIGCLNMRLEHNTYLLDDGKREEVQELAQRLGCGYLTRSGNLHAKAGNINAALKETNGDVIAIFDADMIPQPDFLEKTIRYFDDEKVAIVQLPQEFYNLDSVQHRNNWYEQQLFYRVIQPGKDRIGATFWCGSPSIISRKAFEDIGGAAVESITEDFQTSIRLNARGWKIRYHHEVLAYGIAPQSLKAFNLQRLRWAQGAMQIFRSKDNPLIIKGLTWRQRLSHFSAIFTYFDSYQKLIYLVTPILYLLFGILPIKVADGITFIEHWAPYYFLSLLANITMGRGYFKYFDVEKYNFLKMFTFIRASLIVIWPKALSFKVTPKAVDQTVKAKDRTEILNHFLVLTLMACSLTFGLLHFIDGNQRTHTQIIDSAISSFWLLMNGGLLFFSIRDVLKRLYFRKDYRFGIKINASIEFNKGIKESIILTNISRRGAGIELSNFNQELAEQELTIRFHTPLGEEIELPGQIVFHQSGSGKTKLGVQFQGLSQEQQEKLVLFLFVTLPKYQERSSDSREMIFEWGTIESVKMPA